MGSGKTKSDTAARLLVIVGIVFNGVSLFSFVYFLLGLDPEAASIFWRLVPSDILNAFALPIVGYAEIKPATKWVAVILLIGSGLLNFAFWWAVLMGAYGYIGGILVALAGVFVAKWQPPSNHGDRVVAGKGAG